jgi:hypothetical protein
MPKPMTPEEQARRQRKTKSVRHLAQQIHKLRRKVTKDMKSDDEKTRLTALAVAIMDKTAERVGNEESAENGHVGVTGFKNGQMTIDGNTVTFKYTGKSGVGQEKSFTDELMVKLLKECQGNCKSKDSPVLKTSDGFRIKADKVNRYLGEFDITAKDIRGYAANTLVYNMLKNSKTPSGPDERKKQFRDILKSVAEKVGHQQATLKRHYLLPGAEESYVKSGRVKKIKNASHQFIVVRIAVENAEYCRMAVEYAKIVIPTLEKAYREHFRQPPLLVQFSIQVNDWDLPDGKVGSFLHPDPEKGRDRGVLTLSPKNFQSDKWEVVIRHELIHAILGKDVAQHGKLFDILADSMDIPMEYRD